MACNGCKKRTTGTTAKAKPIQIMYNCQFAFRPNIGHVETSFGSGEFIDNSSLTDELALAFLRVNPSRISMFEIYPKNWMQMLSNDDKAENGQSTSK